MDGLSKYNTYALCVIALIATSLVRDVYGDGIHDESFVHLRALQAVTENPAPEVMWLLSYPGSGEEYVKDIVQEVSKTTMATNYGYDVFPNPSIDDSQNGPYIYRTDLEKPTEAILTDSHCTGYCLYCKDTLHDSDWRQFYVRCGSGNFLDTGIPNAVRYKTEDVSKMVHMYRDPFDNIIDRFYNDHQEQQDANDGHWKYNLDRQGFKEWCDAFDERIEEENGIWLLENIPKNLQSVPCHGLFYQYVLWHNNVAEVMGSLGWRMSEIHLHYADILDNKEHVFELFEFLELPIHGDVPEVPKQPFTSADFFLENERIAISSLMKVMATRDVWEDVRRYLPEPKMQDTYSSLGSHLSPAKYGTWPNLVWLLSFPKSGTDFTLRAVEKLSKFTTATNYASDTGDTYNILPNVAYTEAGPFRRSDRPFSEKYVLVKSNCEVCTYCDPRHKIDYDDFLEGCSRSRSASNVLAYYDTKLIQKIVHIVRNPFDNIVFTFHYRFKKAKQNLDVDFETKYQYAPEGFQNWCLDLDDKFNKKIPAFTGVVAEVAAKIPCYGILFQYVQWHNHAHEVRKKMNVPSLVIHYEDYTLNLRPTMVKIFDFVKHTYIKEIEETLLTDPFLASSVLETKTDYYYTQEQREAVGVFVKFLASDDAYRTLGKYF